MSEYHLIIAVWDSSYMPPDGQTIIDVLECLGKHGIIDTEETKSGKEWEDLGGREGDRIENYDSIKEREDSLIVNLKPTVEFEEYIKNFNFERYTGTWSKIYCLEVLCGGFEPQDIRTIALDVNLGTFDPETEYEYQNELIKAIKKMKEDYKDFLEQISKITGHKMRISFYNDVSSHVYLYK